MEEKSAEKAAESRKIAGSAKFDLKTFLSAAGLGGSAEDYQAKKNIFHQGDPADGVFLVQSGKAELSVISPQGKERVIAILTEGDFFGEGCLAAQPVRMSSAIALVDSVIYKIDKATMVRVLREKPAAAQMFTAFLLSRNIRFEADLVDQLFNSSERRLARVLLLLANFGKEGKLEQVVPPVSQEVLAARVGTTRSRVNFFMNKFRKLGLIEYNGHLGYNGHGHLKVHSALLNIVVHD